MSTKKSNSFYVNKIRKAIERQGSTYTFVKPVLGDYDDNTGNIETVAVIQGFFHEVRIRTKLVYTEGGIARSKPEPSIMCVYEDVEPYMESLIVNSLVTIGLNQYKVLAVLDISKRKAAAEIILELIDNGGVPF